MSAASTESTTAPRNPGEKVRNELERLLETVSFEASDKGGSSVTINAGYVDDHLAELSKNEDLSRYIL